MTCGIYAIVNKVNGKRYVGKSINIEGRWGSHLSQLRNKTRSKDCNRYLYNSFQKHEETSFGFEYLEVLPTDDIILYERELYWMLELNTLDKAFGYNLRQDSGTKCIVHQSTRDLISELTTGESNPNYGNHWNEAQKKHASDIALKNHASGKYSSAETKAKYSEAAKKFWAENPDVKLVMAKKVSIAKTKYLIEQYDKQMNLITIYGSMRETIEQNPDYYMPAIYNCCSGYKKSYRGFIWKKILISEVEKLIIT
jgi:group I intron endonuclease